MDILHHPAFQSLVLPAVLAWAAVWLLGRVAGPRWAALGGALALLVTLAVWPGFDWPATARAQKLPWIVLAGTVLALLIPWRTAEPAGGRGRVFGIVASAVLTVASLALTALAGLGGSLLFAQLALMLACVTAVPGLWSWWRPASRIVMSPAALLPLALALVWLVFAAGPSLAGTDQTPATQDREDPYYNPQWK